MNFISAYGDESSGDDDGKQLPAPISKRKRNVRKRKQSDLKQARIDLPLPASVSNMFCAARKDDRSEEHQGRKRRFAHIVGNWPTHVYLSVDIDVEVQHLCKEIIQNLVDNWKKFCVKLGHDGSCALVSINALPFDLLNIFAGSDETRGVAAGTHSGHLSLSRAVPLRKYQIPLLIGKLRAAFSHTRPFKFDLSGFRIFVNEDKSRSFIALGLADEDCARDLILSTDRVFAELKLPLYYEEKIPHLSFAWTHGDVFTGQGLKDVRRCTCHMANDAADTVASWSKQFRNGGLHEAHGSVEVAVNAVNSKSGNQLYSIELREENRG